MTLSHVYQTHTQSYHRRNSSSSRSAHKPKIAPTQRGQPKCRALAKSAGYLNKNSIKYINIKKNYCNAFHGAVGEPVACSEISPGILLKGRLGLLLFIGLRLFADLSPGSAPEYLQSFSGLIRPRSRHHLNLPITAELSLHQNYKFKIYFITFFILYYYFSRLVLSNLSITRTRLPWRFRFRFIEVPPPRLYSHLNYAFTPNYSE